MTEQDKNKAPDTVGRKRPVKEDIPYEIIL